MLLLTKKSILRHFLWFLLLSFSACSVSSPTIVDTEWQVNLEWGTNAKIHETLSVFVHIQAEHNLDDVENVFIIHDKSNLYWELDYDSWLAYTLNDVQWLGTNGLLPVQDSLFPRGLYRVVLIDKKGQRTSDEFYNNIDIFNNDDFSEPVVFWADTTLKYSLPVESDELTLWIYDKQKVFIAAKYYTWSEEIVLSDLLDSNVLRREAAYLKTYQYSRKHGVGLISDYLPFN